MERTTKREYQPREYQKPDPILTEDAIASLSEHYFDLIKDSDEVFNQVEFKVSAQTSKLKNGCASIIFNAYNPTTKVSYCEGTLYMVDKSSLMTIDREIALSAIFVSDTKHYVICNTACSGIIELTEKLDKYIISFVARSCRRGTGLEVGEIKKEEYKREPRERKPYKNDNNKKPYNKPYRKYN